MASEEIHPGVDRSEYRVSSNFASESHRALFNIYSRTRYQDRSTFMQGLSSEEERWLESKVVDIDMLRSMLEKDEDSYRLFSQLQVAKYIMKGGRDRNRFARAARILVIESTRPKPNHDRRHSPPTALRDPEDGAGDEIYAGVMHFHDTLLGTTGKEHGGDTEGRDHEWSGLDYKGNFADRYLGHFPDQAIRIQYLLDDQEHNPFTAHKNRLRWFHFPVNHIQWVQVSLQGRTPCSGSG